MVETYSSVRWNPPRRGGWSKFSFYGPFCVEESGRDGKERRDERKKERERERKRFWRFYNLSIDISIVKLEINGFYAIRRKKRYNSTSFDQSRFVISLIKIYGFFSFQRELEILSSTRIDGWLKQRAFKLFEIVSILSRRSSLSFSLRFELFIIQIVSYFSSGEVSFSLGSFD